MSWAEPSRTLTCCGALRHDGDYHVEDFRIVRLGTVRERYVEASR